MINRDKQSQKTTGIIVVQGGIVPRNAFKTNVELKAQ